MKKILFILPRLTSGGAERQAVTIAISLKQMGNDVSFICYSEGDFFEEQLKNAGIPIIRKLCNHFKRIYFVSKYIHNNSFDVVISFLPTPNFLNCIAARRGKKWTVITSERSSLETSFKTRRGRIYASQQKYSDAIVCNSENARRMWIRNHPEYECKLKTIYNAVNLPSLSSSYYPKKDGLLHIVIAATIYKIKNPMGLLAALAMMSKEQRGLLRIDWYGSPEAEIGNRSEYEKVLKTIKEQKLQGTIFIHEPTNNILNIMNEGDFTGLFSQLEGLPNAICEAMMIGKPIIMTRCSDYEVLVEDGVNGFLCDWDKPESIKDALLKAVALSKDNLIKMGSVSKQKALKLFDPSAVISKWISLM